MRLKDEKNEKEICSLKSEIEKLKFAIEEDREIYEHIPEQERQMNVIRSA
jgi:hypothetical protein